MCQQAVLFLWLLAFEDFLLRNRKFGRVSALMHIVFGALSSQLRLPTREQITLLTG